MSRRQGVLILIGGATVGLLDILDAFIFFGVRSGVLPTRILQSIAAGLVGRTAFEGGIATAALGLLLHLSIATTIVAAYYFVSKRLPVLTNRPILCGILYGLIVYTVMNHVVVPLSQAGRGAFSLPVFVNAILIHMFGVGIPAALFARAARR